MPSTEWVPVSDLQVDAQLIEELVKKALLLSNLEEENGALLRRRNRQLLDTKWNPYAALYHYMTRWKDINLKGHPALAGKHLPDSRKGFNELVARVGPPPDAFHEHPGSSSVRALPLSHQPTALLKILQKRRTTRRFDRHKSLRIEDLSRLLYYVYGCHGYAYLSDEVVALKKTSPSGGALHPIEVYPLIVRVKGWKPGLYHYRVKDHALAQIRAAYRSFCNF